MKANTIILIILLGFFSCDKDNSELSAIEAKWKIESISGGIHGGGYEANFKYLEFVNDKDCMWLDSLNSVLNAGTYSLSSENSKDYITFESYNDSVYYSFTGFKKELRYISSDTLYMADGCCDLYDYLFIKEN